MKNIFEIIIVVFSIFVVIAILLQQKGSGLSGVFGGSDVSYLSKRGAEKFLVYFTIFCVIVICISALSLIIFV
ncbi:MAG: preprotein translocase subunit SecG [bacterium]